jgi:excisionase family DNA binding protein
MEPTPLLSAAEIAEHLGVHPATVRRLAAARRITCVWVGSTPRFELARVLGELTVEASPAERQAGASAPVPQLRPASAPLGVGLDRRAMRAMKERLYG